MAKTVGDMLGNTIKVGDEVRYSVDGEYGIVKTISNSETIVVSFYDRDRCVRWDQLILTETPEQILKNNFNVHDNLKDESLDDLKIIQKNCSHPYAVATINVDGNLNIGMLIRSAAIFGAEKFFVIGKKKYDRRSCVGSYNYLDIEKLAVDDFHTTMTEQGYWPLFIEQGGQPLSSLIDTIERKYYGWKDRGEWKPVLVFGSESHGIPPELFRNSDMKYSIHQTGVMRSLNVSAAGAIVMHKVMEYYENK